MFTITWLLTGIVHVLGYPYIQRMYERTLVKEVAAAEPIAEVEEAVEPEEEVEEEPLEEEEDEDTDEAF